MCLYVRIRRLSDRKVDLERNIEGGSLDGLGSAHPNNSHAHPV